MRSLFEIRQIIEKLAGQINSPASAMPTYDNFRNDGTPNIEVSNSVYYYRALDRDSETMNQQTSDLDLLLYWIFRDITFSMACEYELANRNPDQDFRRIMFEHQVELLTLLSPQWGERESQEHEQILKQNPFDDYANTRATLCENLRGQGHSPEVAWRMACEKYPLPKGA
jgi:hypothetical protein